MGAGLRSIFRNNGIYVTLCIALIVLSFYVSRAITTKQLASAQALAVPFVLKMDIYGFRHRPGGEVFTSKVVARRSDGATVESYLDPKWGEQEKEFFTSTAGQ